MGKGTMNAENYYSPSKGKHSESSSSPSSPSSSSPALSARRETFDPFDPHSKKSSDDSFVALYSYNLETSKFDSDVPVDQRQKFTSGRDSVRTPVATKPIAIAVPGRKRHFHTPLSARGDLIGGYFPLHEASQQSFETHPFNKPLKTDYDKMYSDSTMSNASVPDPSQHTSPYRPQYMHSPQDFTMNTTPETPPLVSMPPLGKYHPANYQNKTPSITLCQPRSQATSSPRPIPPQHERPKSSSNQSQKQLLQKYQRDMVEQATRGARRAGAYDPAAPKLLPLGSPGPVTPMELEESNVAGYLVAGAKRGSVYRQGENKRESDMVERMIRAEEERRRREGQSSPVATAGGF